MEIYFGLNMSFLRIMACFICYHTYFVSAFLILLNEWCAFNTPQNGGCSQVFQPIRLTFYITLIVMLHQIQVNKFFLSDIFLCSGVYQELL